MRQVCERGGGCSDSQELETRACGAAAAPGHRDQHPPAGERMGVSLENKFLLSGKTRSALPSFITQRAQCDTAVTQQSS